MIELEVYTDGACNQMANTGGWAFTILENKKVKVKKSGKVKDTTNNQCEMLAAIHSIKEIESIMFDKPISIKLYSDSAYLVNAFVEDWFSKWKENGWRNAKGEAVANKELWESLIVLQDKNKVEFIKIKRCSNEFAKSVDKMAKNPTS